MIANMLANQGRRGDTMLAHINPQEASLLQQQGGVGTANPVTGLPQFYPDDGTQIGPDPASPPIGIGTSSTNPGGVSDEQLARLTGTAAQSGQVQPPEQQGWWQRIEDKFKKNPALFTSALGGLAGMAGGPMAGALGGLLGAGLGYGGKELGLFGKPSGAATAGSSDPAHNYAMARLGMLLGPYATS
jgi:hypothetical protein